MSYSKYILKFNKISVIICVIVSNNLRSQTNQNSHIEPDYTPVKLYVDGSAMSDSKVDNSLYIKKENNYYKKVLNRSYSLLDFGAVGDGKTNDFEAFKKAVNFISKSKTTTLLIPDNYIFNLGDQSINFDKKDIILDFDGGIITNATLVGNKTKIKADRIKIFGDNVKLAGSFGSVTDYAYPEWFGSFADNDESKDLVDTLRSLDSVFYDISLGEGAYFTKKGEYTAKGIKGLSMAKTKVIYNTNKSNTYLFSLGEISAPLQRRNYDYNYIKDVTMSIAPLDKRLQSNTVVIVGSAHKASLTNIKCVQNSPLQQISKNELQQIANDASRSSIANTGIEFKGDSELTNISNAFVLSDIGIKFSEYTDFVQVLDFTTWLGKYGLASVYFKSAATGSTNILFSGSQSWCQGLYGLYTENSVKPPSFPNVKFENVRIEQLTSEIQTSKKLAGASVWIGNNNEYIANLELKNIMLSGTSNGIHIGETHYGKIVLDNILTFSDEKIKKDFALETFHRNQDSPLIIYLKNIALQPNVDSKFNNASIIYNGFVPENNLKKNMFNDNIIIGKTTTVKSYGFSGKMEEVNQQLSVPANNTDMISLNNFNLKKLSNIVSIRYKVSMYSKSNYDEIEFVLLKNGSIKTIGSKAGSSVITISDMINMNVLNLVQDKDSGLIFIYNRLKDNCFLDIKTTVITE